ncbi:MAG: ROK family protein [Leptospiraceae bacterium]|nr:ROK family protein [Leptospiraceae bacterium]
MEHIERYIIKNFIRTNNPTTNWASFEIGLIPRIISSAKIEKAKGKGYYPVPLNDYVAFPLIYDLFMYIRDKKDTTGNFIFEQIQYHSQGKLDVSDNFIGSIFEIFSPELQRVSSNQMLYLIVQKFIASNAVNLGILNGYDRITTKSKNQITNELITKLLKNPKAGFALLIRYIETYLRSHDVYVSEDDLINPLQYKEKLKEQKNLFQNGMAASATIIPFDQTKKPFSIGIDIGGTSIKFKLYDSNNQPNTIEHRINTGARKPYNQFKDFIILLIDGISELLRKTGFSKLDIDTVGICWPGAIREQKIAGASGIFNNFAEIVASGKIRENTVEMFRVLDFIKEFRIYYSTRISYGICNDGNAEAIGKLLNIPELSYFKWAIIKLGTGTGSAILYNGEISEGINEFGKLILNLYFPPVEYVDDSKKQPTHILEPAKDAQGNIIIDPATGNPKFPAEDRTPVTVNDVCSQKLYPKVFNELTYLNFNITSFEIGKIGEYYLEKTNPISEDDIIFDIGLEILYISVQDKISKSDLKNSLKTEPFALDEREKKNKKDEGVKEKLGIKTKADLIKKIEDTGNNRIKEILVQLLPTPELSITSITGLDGKSMLLSIKSGGHSGSVSAFFQKLFDVSGSILSDVIMLVYKYYKMNGVVLCGGVIAPTITTEALLKSIQLHLDKKYGFDFRGLDVFNENLNNGLIGKEKRNTIYHHFKDNFSDLNAMCKDHGEIGALYHAKIVKEMNPIEEDTALETLSFLDELEVHKKFEERELESLSSFREGFLFEDPDTFNASERVEWKSIQRKLDQKIEEINQSAKGGNHGANN